MTEEERLKDLLSYKILDTCASKELDELVQIASAICNTPISLISLVDDSRQWFKSKKGIEVSETPRSFAFCQHALQNSSEVLVVDKPLQDERFKNNPLVTGNPKIRFYAGAPLKTPSGGVLGTLCVIDTKPREINSDQKKALQLLSKRVMDSLNQRKLLLEQESKLKLGKESLNELTKQVASFFVHLEIDKEGNISLPFVSKSIVTTHAKLTKEVLRYSPELVLEIIHPDDKVNFIETIKNSFDNHAIWSHEFRVKADNGIVQWYLGKAIPEEKANGTVVWYATFQNVSIKKDYEQALADILFYVSHVLRKPVANLLTIAEVVEKEKEIDEETLKLYSKYIKVSSEELDGVIKILNKDYFERKIKL